MPSRKIICKIHFVATLTVPGPGSAEYASPRRMSVTRNEAQQASYMDASTLFSGMLFCAVCVSICESGCVSSLELRTKSSSNVRFLAWRRIQNIRYSSCMRQKRERKPTLKALGPSAGVFSFVCSILSFNSNESSSEPIETRRYSHLRMKRDQRKRWMKWLNKCLIQSRNPEAKFRAPLPKTASKFPTPTQDSFTPSRMSAHVSLCFYILIAAYAVSCAAYAVPCKRRDGFTVTYI